jgi:thioredoxin 1
MMKVSLKLYIILLLVFASIFIQAEETKPVVTFIELGSTTCIPCKKMKPVMKAVENRFGKQVKVIFIDTNKNQEAVKKYGIKIIPTQIFLDASGKEIHRHEGFYPEKKIIKLLVDKGLK